MVKFSAIISLLLLLNGTIEAQQDSVRLVQKLEGTFVRFETDHLQQLYTIDSRNEIRKYRPDGTIQFTYNNNKLGPIGSFDVSNPLNPLVFYPDLQTLILLDRTLSPVSEVSLLEWDIFQAGCMATSVDNKIWIYDEVRFILKKVDQEGNILLESNNLSLVLPQPPQAIQMQARLNQVYLNDPAQGILVFDQFGQYQKTLDFKEVDYFKVLGERLLLFHKGILQIYNQKNFQLLSFPLPFAAKAEEKKQEVRQISIQKDRLYILDKEGIQVFRF